MLSTLDDRDRQLSVFHLASDIRVLDGGKVRLQDDLQGLVFLCQCSVELEFLPFALDRCWQTILSSSLPLSSSQQPRQLEAAHWWIDFRLP